MTPITISTNLEDAPWSDIDLPDDKLGQIERVGILPNATAAGLAVAAVAIRMPDGTVVIGQTTLRLFNLAARAIAATPISEAEAPR